MRTRSLLASKQRGDDAGPFFIAAAAEALRTEEQEAWSRGSPVECPHSSKQNHLKLVKDAFDLGGSRGKGVVLGPGRYELGNESLNVMDGRLGGVSRHLFVKGRDHSPLKVPSTRKRDTPSLAKVAWLDGSCVFGTPLYWSERSLPWNNGWEVRLVEPTLAL